MSEFPKKIPLTEVIKRTTKNGEVEEISEFVISRSPKAKDFKGISMQNMTFDDTFRMISRICNQPLHIVEELDASDMIILSEEINSFLPNVGQ